MKQVAAGKSKARCLALLDEVAATGEGVVVTKRGRPVAKVVPVGRPPRDPRRLLRGSVVEEIDIVSPVGAA